jgi:transmembrane sensor
MTQATHIAQVILGPDAEAAADWVVRLSGEPAEADWLAFEAWLNAGAARRGAYDRALTLWLELDGQAEPLGAAILADVDAPPSRAPRARSRGPALWWSGAMMSVAAVAVTFAALHPDRPAQPDIYTTAKGERRQIVLSDGTRLALNTGSSLSVRMGRGERRITLAQGEAAFQVVHDANRPFVVEAGDRVLRDLGTDFDVMRANGQITVTVREGMVAVQRTGTTRSLSLGPGSRLEHREGALDSMITTSNTDDAFAWRVGRLIYRDRPLAEVASDLNRYGEDQVQVAGGAADLRFSGVLTIDNQPAMVQRLTELLPVASTRKDGVIVLRELNLTR